MSKRKKLRAYKNHKINYSTKFLPQYFVVHSCCYCCCLLNLWSNLLHILCRMTIYIRSASVVLSIHNSHTYSKRKVQKMSNSLLLLHIYCLFIAHKIHFWFFFLLPRYQKQTNFFLITTINQTLTVRCGFVYSMCQWCVYRWNCVYICYFCILTTYPYTESTSIC